MKKSDFIIIGAGIVGLATALKLLKAKPELKITILEKENRLGKHQTGNNSGVIHSGIYYKPGSSKARNCRIGYEQLLKFCNQNQIDYKLTGKIIVAINQNEEIVLNEIYNRGVKNGLEKLKFLSNKEITEIEPFVSGTKAIFVSQTGIVDFNDVLIKYAELITAKGGTIIFNSRVVDIKEKTDEIEIITQDSTFNSDYLISCAGLQSDRIAKLTKKDLDFRIIPFRGEYYKLKQGKNHLVKTLVYPVPDPAFPFLGVHFTKKINGDVEAGPNAVLAFKREGYSKISFSLQDTLETFGWKGFRKVAVKYWKTGFGEFYRSFSKSAFTKALQKLVPSITMDDLEMGGAGVRAQACDINGNLLDDFSFVKSKRVLHVCNAPSPAATASLAIGEQIKEMILN